MPSLMSAVAFFGVASSLTDQLTSHPVPTGVLQKTSWGPSSVFNVTRARATLTMMAPLWYQRGPNGRMLRPMQWAPVTRTSMPRRLRQGNPNGRVPLPMQWWGDAVWEQALRTGACLWNVKHWLRRAYTSRTMFLCCVQGHAHYVPSSSECADVTKIVRYTIRFLIASGRLKWCRSDHCITTDQLSARALVGFYDGFDQTQSRCNSTLEQGEQKSG